MSQQVQYRRGTTAQNDLFTGAQGEITVDTTTSSLRVHDGSTQGGHAVPSVTAGILAIPGAISATGNVTGTYFLGNGALLSGIVAGSSTSISNGTSNVRVVASNGNVAANVAGTANVLVLASTGAYVTGAVSASGNVTGNYILGNGALLSGITGGGVQTLIADGTSNVRVTVTSGNIAANVGAVGNVWVLSATGQYVTGVVSASGNVTGSYILGNGALLTGVITSVANINNGTSNVRIDASGGNVAANVAGTANVLVLANTGAYVTGVVSATGNVTGNFFIGNGSLLTGIAGGGGGSSISNGNSNIVIASNSNATVAIAGVANIAVFSTSGVNVTGNVSANNINLATRALISQLVYGV